MSEHWTPKKGDEVWMNHPDFSEAEGVVIGFVSDGARAGQPVIERQRDRPGGQFTRAERKGDQVVIAPLFLLPFKYGGPEWRKARDEGRIHR